MIAVHSRKEFRMRKTGHRWRVTAILATVGMIFCAGVGCDGDGETVTVPDGLVVVIDGDMTTSWECHSIAYQQGAFVIELRVSNTTGETIVWTLPAGTKFIPNSGDAQTLMLLQPYVVTVSAGQYLVICLPVYCLNADLDAPDSEYSYTLGEVETRGCIVQMIIWECIETGKLSAENRAYLLSL
jgi:hypothetical protein